MHSPPEGALDRACGRWLAFVEDHPGWILLVTLVLTVIFGVYSAFNITIDADPRNLINPKLPFQVRQRQMTAAFGTISDGFIVVVDADSPFAAGGAAERLAQRSDLFNQVYVPGGGPFYARNALLYLEPRRAGDWRCPPCSDRETARRETAAPC